MSYIPTIGLEIHAELKTRTKMFCDSPNDPFNADPNTNICPVCLAHPGTLPVINREAVKHVLRVGLALNGKLADYTEFDRKTYFYPDLPKGYQISQYEYPLVRGGELNSIAVTRVHLEEDTASSAHGSTSFTAGDEGAGTTLIDYNRAGVPLMELVTEPVIRSAKQAGDFARELQLLLRTLGASDANMEKGEMRVEANVSVSKSGTLGTKVEIKNLNSFRAMERAVEYEIKRQTETLEREEEIVQETRGWDEAKQATFVQRAKEGSADYRYFPDPDLPSIRVSEIEEFSDVALLRTMPELPSERRARYLGLGLAKQDADLLVREPVLGSYLEAASDLLHESRLIKTAANYICNDLVSHVRDMEQRDSDFRAEIPISSADFSKIISLVSDGTITSRAAKDALAAGFKENPDLAGHLANDALLKGSIGMQDVVAKVIAENPKVVDDFKKGKGAALQFLVGQVMKVTEGKADPVEARERLVQQIG